MPTHYKSPRNNKLTRHLVLHRYSCSQPPRTPSATTERSILRTGTTHFTLSGFTPRGLRSRTVTNGTLLMQLRFAKITFFKRIYGEVLSIMYVKAILQMSRLPKKKQSANNWLRPRQRAGSTPLWNQKTVTVISATLTTSTKKSKSRLKKP